MSDSSGPSELGLHEEDVAPPPPPPPPQAAVSIIPKRQKLQLSLSMEERIMHDPILARHFDGLETPSIPELIRDPFDILSTHWLRTSHRLVRTVDAAGVKYVNQYIVIKLLGYGSYGKVKLCLNTLDSKLYAIKIIDRKRLIDRRLTSENQDHDVLQGSSREIAILKKLYHPNIVALHEVIDDIHQNKLYLVLEYAEGGPIMKTNHRVAIPEDQARKHFIEICCGLDYLHYHKVLHRDLKPENLLKAGDGRIKISDFGVSRVFEKSDAVSSTAGTPAFLAPEVCSESSYEGRPVDIWALGCLLNPWELIMGHICTINYLSIAAATCALVCLYVFVFGVVPFPAKTVPETYHAIVHKERRILNKDPHARITLPSVMEHAWLTQSSLPALHSLSRSDPQAAEATVPISPHELQAAYTTNTSGMEMLFNVGLEERTYEPGEYIFREGEEDHEIFFIDSGKCEVLDDSIAAAEYNHGGQNEVGPGQVVGGMTLFSQPADQAEGPRKQTSSIRARTSVTTLVVKKCKVMEALGESPEVVPTGAMERMKRQPGGRQLYKVHTLALVELLGIRKAVRRRQSSTTTESTAAAKCRCANPRWCTVM